MAKITIALTDDEHERFVQAKMRRKEKSLQSLMIGATEKLLAESIPISDESRTAKNRSDESALTDDQRDILAMLGEDPEKDFLFSSIQTTVRHALEQYRRKWKPKTKEKATGKGGQSQRLPTGTR